MTKKKTYTNNLFFQVAIYFLFVFSTIFSLIISKGYYGFGVDYYHSYQFDLPDEIFITDYIGWLLATLNINGFKLGVFISAFIISFSSGLILLVFFNELNLNKILVFFFIFIVLIHSWPVFPSITNVMRQGLMMSFIFFALYFLNKGKLNNSFLFFLIALFTHKSGLFFFIIFLTLLTFNKFKKNHKNLLNLYVLFGIISLFLSVTFFLALNYFQLISINQHNEIIGKDFSAAFFVINILYILYFLKFYKYLLKNYFNFYIYLFSIFISGCYFLGLIWQHERFNMIMLIPYILSIGNCFSKNSKITYAVVIFSLLFALTLYTGMYKIGVGIY